MGIEVRAIEPGEIEDMQRVDRIGFGAPPPSPAVATTWSEAELDRTRVAFESGHAVGASRAYSFEVTVPGGRRLPAAAVSWVAVLPTHRRRGVLRAMLDALHAEAHERGEPVAMLTASESGIYGRFGYGVATWRLGLSAERRAITFAAPGSARGTMRVLDRDDAEIVLPAVYEQVRSERAGMVSRPSFWWPQVFWGWSDSRPTTPFFVAAHFDGTGRADGYVAYELSGEWAGGIPDLRLLVRDLQATNPEARAALWEYVFGVDLVATVAAVNLPVDEPLRHLVTDPRQVRVDFVNDGLWILPLEPAALLGARTYSVAGSVCLEVRDATGGQRVMVDGGPDGAIAEPTHATPDLSCDRAALGAAALGGNRWSTLVAAGRVEEHTPGSARHADLMFATDPLPAMTSHF